MYIFPMQHPSFLSSLAHFFSAGSIRRCSPGRGAPTRAGALPVRRPNPQGTRDPDQGNASETGRGRGSCTQGSSHLKYETLVALSIRFNNEPAWTKWINYQFIFPFKPIKLETTSTKSLFVNEYSIFIYPFWLNFFHSLIQSSLEHH